MGREYRINFAYDSQDRLDRLLRSHPHFTDYDVEHDLYNFRITGNENLTQIPDAYITVTPGGIIFCDCCGNDASIILGAAIHRFVSSFGKVEINEE